MNHQSDIPANHVDSPVVTFSNIPLDDAPEPVGPGVSAQSRQTVVGIQFKEGGKIYSFDPGALTISAGDEVIIDTARGLEYGFCATGNHTVPANTVVAPLRPVLRLATEQDRAIRQNYRKREPEAMAICQRKIQEHGLEMKLVSTEFSFDGSRILFYFTADGRVDFRELVRDLAGEFHTRIELRQIGVRDEAKLMGGLGICGRPFCCKQFLDDFQPVSIKMAKTQNLSLNPAKISGCCGRLMCCLKYEQDTYESLIKSCPKTESIVNTYDGRGTVTEINLLKQTVKVRLDSDPSTIKTYSNEEICILRNGRGRRTDPSIPEDIPPLPRPEPKTQETESPPLFDESLSILSNYTSAPEPPAEPQPVPAEQSSKPNPRRNSRSGNRKHSRGSSEKQKPVETAKFDADNQQQRSGRNRRRGGWKNFRKRSGGNDSRSSGSKNTQ